MRRICAQKGTQPTSPPPPPSAAAAREKAERARPARRAACPWTAPISASAALSKSTKLPEARGRASARTEALARAQRPAGRPAHARAMPDSAACSATKVRAPSAASSS